MKPKNFVKLSENEKKKVKAGVVIGDCESCQYWCSEKQVCTLPGPCAPS